MPGKRRRLYPMPIEALADHPLAMTLPAAGYGILLRLVIHFYVSRCEPLPIADHELRGIARAHSPTWRHWKERVLRIFNDVRPDLEAYQALRDVNGTSLSIGRALGHSRKRLAQAVGAAQPAYQPAILPKHDAEKVAARERREAIAEPKPARPMLTDRPQVR